MRPPAPGRAAGSASAAPPGGAVAEAGKPPLPSPGSERPGRTGASPVVTFDARSTPLPGSQPRPSPQAQQPQPIDKPAAPQQGPSAATADVATELRQRAERLRSSDPVGAARALVELGIHEERVLANPTAARRSYERARQLSRTLEPALSRLQRLIDARSELAIALEIVEDKLRVAEADAIRADLLSERARLLQALGRTAESCEAFGEALRLAPLHAASLRGLEIVLRRESARGIESAARDLAAHLDRLAEAYAPGRGRPDGDGHLAAWLHVERAAVLDRKLNKADLAFTALEGAVVFDAGPGPVRDALRRHLLLHDNIAGLVAALSVEADHERDDDRAARLLYAAGRLLVDKLNAPADAVNVLSKASSRAPAGTPTARRVLAELIRLLEASGALELAVSVRQKELALLADDDAIAHEHVRLAETYEILGNAEQTALHAARALERDPEDAATRERLDRALQRLGNHEQRVETWTAVANGNRPTEARVAALLRAAEICEHKLRRRDEAIATLRAAWAIDPGNGAVFDALSALLAPKPLFVEEDPRGVRERIDLYTQAATATEEPARKIGLLEKLVSIWEDELGQPARALEELEKILEIDPQRRSAILAMQRNAARAGDAQRLARALCAEAELSGDRRQERRLLLRAAEVTELRLQDRDRASALVDRALSLDPDDPEALRARFRLDERSGRYEDARRAMVRLIHRDPKSDAAFVLWTEVAALDERRLKRPQGAVEAYREAARIKPGHPLPRLEIARLLRDTGEHEKLVGVLISLADEAQRPDDQARLLFQAAEVQELALGRDQDALRSLSRADAALASRDPDPAILEAMERIYVRAGGGGAGVGLGGPGAHKPALGARPSPNLPGMSHAMIAGELAALYARWLERKPPALVDYALRVALALVLADGSPRQSVDILEALVAVVPNHAPALRMLEQLYRLLDVPAPLAKILRAEAEVFASLVARAGALWEIAWLEEPLGQGAALAALERIVKDAPRDAAALSAILRIAGKPSPDAPAALPAQGAFVDAIRNSRELTTDPVARAFYCLEEALLAEAQADADASAARAALAGFRSALALWPESMLAARGLDRLAQRLGDRAGVIAAQLALAGLVHGERARASHLVRAAELTAEDATPEASARSLALYEDALRVDPNCVAAARALAQRLAGEPQRLADRLGEALAKATVAEALVLLGREIAQAVLQHHGRPGALDPGVGVAAVRRVLGKTPDDPTALLLLARLLKAQRVWLESRDALRRAIFVAGDAETKITAHFLLADLYEGPLSDPALAQDALQAVLSIDAQNRAALERLHKLAVARGDHALVLRSLGRLVEIAPDPLSRVETGLRLADAYRDAGDTAGVVRTLCDAIVSAPGDGRAWTALARLYRVDTSEGATAYGKALAQLIDLAVARRVPLDPRWLTTLGLLEATLLIRPREGLAHLQQAVALPGAPPEARTALGRGFEAAGRNAEAVQVLRDILTADAEILARLPDLSHALAALEAALAKDGRAEERLTVEEVRACLGEVSPERLARLRSRRMPAEAPYAGAFAGPEIGRLLVPEARSPWIDVALAIAPVAAKAIRFELGNLGISSRERLSPRDNHPTRMLAERIGRALGIEGFELYLAPSWQGAARVFPGDPPAIVAPTSFVDLPELEQTFALARLFARIALGFTFLDEIPVEATDGLLVSALRTINPGFGSGELSPAREHAVQQTFPGVQRAIGRRQRKMLEEIAPSVVAGHEPRAFVIGLRRSEYRIGYLLCGDTLAAIDYLRRFDRDVARSTEEPRLLLQHPVTNELLRYALTAEAYAERRRAGAVWPSL